MEGHYYIKNKAWYNSYHSFILYYSYEIQAYMYMPYQPEINSNTIKLIKRADIG